MKDEWTDFEMKAAHYLLEGMGFIATEAAHHAKSDKHRMSLYTHPEGYEVQVDFSNRYPFNLRYPGQQEWDLEFSFDGLVDQLYQIQFKEGT